MTSTPATGTPTTSAFTWDAAGRMTGRAGQTLSDTPDGKLATTSGQASGVSLPVIRSAPAVRGLPRCRTRSEWTGRRPCPVGVCSSTFFGTSSIRGWVYTVVVVTLACSITVCTSARANSGQRPEDKCGPLRRPGALRNHRRGQGNPHGRAWPGRGRRHAEPPDGVTARQEAALRCLGREGVAPR